MPARFDGVQVKHNRVNTCAGDWMPIAAITSFNVGDLIGKVMPLTSIPSFQPQGFSRLWLAKAVTARCVFIPLLIMTAAPLGHPVLKGAGCVVRSVLLE